MGLNLSSRFWDENTPCKFTGLSAKQKKAIKNSWKLLEKDRAKHASNIFHRTNVTMALLATDPYMQRHCIAFMKELDYLIYVVIYKPKVLSEAIENLSKIHKDMHIHGKDVKRLTKTLVSYFKKEFPVKFGPYEIDTWTIFLDAFRTLFVNTMSAQRQKDDEEEEERVKQADLLLEKEQCTPSKTLVNAEREFWANRRKYWKDKHASWHGNALDLKEIDENDGSKNNNVSTRETLCPSFPLCGLSKKKNDSVASSAGSTDENKLLTAAESRGSLSGGNNKTHKIGPGDLSPLMLAGKCTRAITITIAMPNKDESRDSAPVERGLHKVTFDSKLTLFTSNSEHTEIRRQKPFDLHSIFCLHASEREKKTSRQLDAHFP